VVFVVWILVQCNAAVVGIETSSVRDDFLDV
jgi:hypothetical protein